MAGNLGPLCHKACALLLCYKHCPTKKFLLQGRKPNLESDVSIEDFSLSEMVDVKYWICLFGGISLIQDDVALVGQPELAQDDQATAVKRRHLQGITDKMSI